MKFLAPLSLVVLCLAGFGAAADCEDSEGFYFPGPNGEKVYCAEAIAQFPCRCTQTVSGYVIKDKCCKSCAAADVSECNCQDKVTAANPIRINPGSANEIAVNSCADLAKDYPDLCAKYGGEENYCCKSCKNIDTSCLDNSRARFTTESKTDLTCAELIAEDKCYCVKFAENCCASCENVGTSDCCLDDPDFKVTVKIPRNRKLGTPKKICKKCKCSELIIKDTTGLLLAKACRENINGARDKCCRTCAGIKY